MLCLNINKKNKTRNSQGGFFIAELIVAIFIFGVVMMVSVGALLTALDSNKKAQATKSVLNNLNIVLDTMTKTLAVGTYYRCDSYAGMPTPEDPLTLDCPEGSSPDGISFLFNEDFNKNGEIDDIINYRFMETPGGNGYIARTVYCATGIDCPDEPPAIRMTSPEIDISQASFYVTGAEPGSDGEQPKVLIVVKGVAFAGNRAAPSEFMVQTLVTQRVPDFDNI